MTMTQRVARHNAAAAEATISAEDAIAYAKELREQGARWPRRRWRVEGTAAGNSKLLTEERAIAVQRRTGGTVVLIIPTPTELGLAPMTVNTSLAIGLPTCAVCQQKPGEPCRTPKGKSRPPHEERVKASKPPPPPMPERVWIHEGARAPHTECGSLTTCNCTCRFCRKAWKEAGRPGGPRPARAAGGIVRSHRDMPDEPNEPGLPPGGFA